MVVEFFITFARFECALKSSIEFANGNGDRVEANWGKFASSIRDSFNPHENKELKDAVDYMIQHPPKIQILLDGELKWRDRVFQPNEPQIHKICQHLRDIRNNLFHGGKFQGNYQEDVSRNYILLNNSIIILNEWLNLDSNVKRNFLTPIS